jgi:isoleucyl-tRNA synthetase
MQLRETYQQKSESAAVVLLLIVLLTLLRPITPFITDGLAHQFFKAQHEQLHQLSINHLDEDLQNANKESAANNKTINFEQIFIYCIEINSLSNIYIPSLLTFFEPEFNLLSKNEILTIQPPDATFTVCPDEYVRSAFFI